MFSSLPSTRQSRTSRACEGCRRRKIKCSGGTVCEGCLKSNETCKYRQHYRALNGYPIKIIHNPTERVKRRKSSTTTSPIPVSSSPEQKALPLDISSKKRLSSSSSIASSFSSPSSSFSSTCSTSINAFSPSSPMGTPPAIPLFSPIIFTPNVSKITKQIDSIDPKSRVSPTSSSNLQKILAPINSQTPPNTNSTSGSLEFRRPSRIPSQINDLINSIPLSTFNPALRKLKAQQIQFELNKISQSSIKHSCISPSLCLTEEQMLQCLAKYFTVYHNLLPMLDPDAWYRKAKTAWRALEYGSILSFNQIELAIVYLLIALGARECGSSLFFNIPAKEWSTEYFERTQKIIPNVLEVPACLCITQFMFISSMYHVLTDEREAYTLSEAAIQTATSLGLHNLLDSTKYADLPALNALESHRTWICAYLWNQLICIATNHSAKYTHIVLNPRAFIAIGYHNSNILMHQIKMVELIHQHHTEELTPVFETDRCILSAFGDRSRYIQATPPAPLSSGIASQLNRSVDTREWLHFRLNYWFAHMSLYKPFLLAQANCENPPLDWRHGTEKCIDGAQELLKLILNSNASYTYDLWKLSLFAEQCASVFLYHAMFCNGGPLSFKLFQKCTEFLKASDSLTCAFLQIVEEEPLVTSEFKLDHFSLAKSMFSRKHSSRSISVTSRRRSLAPPHGSLSTTPSWSIVSSPGSTLSSVSPCSSPISSADAHSPFSDGAHDTHPQVWQKVMKIFI